MKINVLQCIDGAKQARGLTVIIDVFRAFSVACSIMANGAERIIPVADLSLAYQLKKEHPHWVLIGERKGRKPYGFDYGNSPTEIEVVDFSGKIVVQTTSAGTRGIVHAKHADEIITGAFVNAQAIVKYIKRKKPQEVSLVAMGSAGVVPSEEDRLCALYLQRALQNKPMVFSTIVARLSAAPAAKKFFDTEKPWAPERDFNLCLALNRFHFVLKVEPYKELISLVKEGVK